MAEDQGVTAPTEDWGRRLRENLTAPSPLYARLLYAGEYRLVSRRAWIDRQRDDYMHKSFSQRKATGSAMGRQCRKAQ